MLNYGINYTALWDMDFGVEAQYVSERTTGQTPALLPEYRVYNFMVSKKIKDLKLWARVDNFTNERYQTRVAYPLPGTTWTTGISVKFWN
jgi:outer membrane receptor protein involved in Fe transport